LTVALLCVLALTGCEQHDAPQSACTPPTVVQPANPASYGGQRDLARYCIKLNAYNYARQALAVAQVAAVALKQCAANEAATVAALRRTGPVYPYQRQEIDADLAHLAQVSAMRARSRGCGAPGQTLLDVKP
jgi:hypothetical protein